MNILVLSPHPEGILPAFENACDDVLVFMDKFNMDFLKARKIDYVVSYGYRHIIKGDVLEQYSGRMANLHVSFLPDNRGADPNFWSFFDNTKKGVTIHLIDAGIDTGDILVQSELHFTNADTLYTSYWSLRNRIEDLFVNSWPDIRQGQLKAIKQDEGGTFHKFKDKDVYFSLLPDGWDTPVGVVEELGSAHASGA